MLNTFLVPELRRIERLETTWFQQGGATAHGANIRLRQQFLGWLISRFGDIHWPSSLWGYLKEKVFSSRKETIAELQASISDEIAAIPRDMLAHVMDSVLFWLHSCEVNEGGHLLNVIFKKW